MNYKINNNRATHITVSRKAIKHNLQRVRDLVPNASIMAVIKANGYGHNILEVANALGDANEFAVTDLDDVALLRANGVNKQVTMLSSRFDTDDLNVMAEQNVRPVIYDFDQLNQVAKLSEQANLDVWIKVCLLYTSPSPRDS